jgi:hypothetical protein
MTSSPIVPVRRRRRRRRGPSSAQFWLVFGLLVVVAAGVFVWRLSASGSPSAPATPAHNTSASTSIGGQLPVASLPATPGPINTGFAGLTTFRGNATRDWYGEGPLPRHPAVLWRYPATGGMCSVSADNGITFRGGTKTWCGTGWTGQPNVVRLADGTIEIREGAYDGRYHFLNGRTGKPTRPDLVTGDLAKGSATSDADGYPLYYAGSRDNWLRVVALDRVKPTVLWKLNAMTSVPHPLWNNDWDAASLQIGDYLLEGGENSWFYVIRLNRRYGTDGLVEVAPKIMMKVPGWDREERRSVGDTDLSIENSVVLANGIAYFSNSGGLVQGWDIRNILAGGTGYRRVFRFWAGDDVDATMVMDPEGYLIVARHIEDNLPRPKSAAIDQQIGNLMKLDPRKPDNPLVWSVKVGSLARGQGILGTPAYYRGVIYALATNGELVAVQDSTGRVLWRMSGFAIETWMSPVAIDAQLLVGDCAGVLRDLDISDPSVRPKELWRVRLEGCIESTPAVWHGMIWVGSRGGAIYGIGDRG